MSGIICNPDYLHFVPLWMTALAYPPEDFGEDWTRFNFKQRNWILKSLQMCTSGRVMEYKKEVLEALQQQYSDNKHNPPQNLLMALPTIPIINQLWGRVYATGDKKYMHFLLQMIDIPITDHQNEYDYDTLEVVY